MKITALPTNRARQMSGFTLIEMIGVLAVIAILAAVLIPKVFEAINNARVNNAAMSVNSMKTSCIDHYAKFGTFPTDGSTTPATTLTPPYDAFDTVLVKEGLADKPFAVKIGDGTTGATGARVRIVPAATTVGANLDGLNAATAQYNLSGNTSQKGDTIGTWLVEAVITGVTLADARALNAAIDGTSTGMGEGAGNNDFGGRVIYAANGSNPVEVHIYLTHR
jgi:prepilin-type N-terminal cleavage/methylation domain-containing protein